MLRGAYAHASFLPEQVQQNQFDYLSALFICANHFQPATQNYIFLWLWAVLAAAFIALLILITVQPYVILTANTIKIRQTPFSLREYRLDRLQFHKKGTEFIIFHYLGKEMRKK